MTLTFDPPEVLILDFKAKFQKSHIWRMGSPIDKEQKGYELIQH